MLDRDKFESLIRHMRTHFTMPGDFNAYLSWARIQTSLDQEFVINDFVANFIHYSKDSIYSITALSELLARWDFEKESGWIVKSKPNTSERRKLIYSLLCFPEILTKRLDELCPFAPDPSDILCSDSEFGWEYWYSSEFQKMNSYYFAYYLEIIRNRIRNGIDVADFISSTADVVGRLAAPFRDNIYASRGLVVGYVQSGKTGHMTGVIARAADSGYRLFIILAGQTDLLRKQTQRRIDKDLIGINHIHNDDYPDMSPKEFQNYPSYPSPDMPPFGWHRLTTLSNDFSTPENAMDLLNFSGEIKDKTKPLYQKDNLFALGARIIVIKKNSSVMGHLTDYIEKVADKFRLSEIPAIIIDDEADNASINTKKQQDRSANDGIIAEEKERTAVNKNIVKILKYLKRAQYIGYTATPFANVFINPNDYEDIFPRDYIISLSRPRDYMGCSDFFDSPIYSKPDDFSSNKIAYVREVIGPDAKDDNLPRAIRSWILAGAAKLWRIEKYPIQFEKKFFIHHTMLVHNSTSTYVHDTDRSAIEACFVKCMNNSEEQNNALRILWETDFIPVWKAKSPDTTITPPNFNEISPFISECIQKIRSPVCLHTETALIVNGTDQDQAPDYDLYPVWKIIVGGAKLARGYTLEGLTISYYRRRAGTADTLMQMGRWFGYRPGYRDLVRLFIGTKELPNSKRKSKLKTKGSS